MISLFIALALIGLSLAYYQHRLKKVYAAINTMPGPPTLPFVGNAHLIGKTPKAILNTQFSWWKTYGPNIYRVWIGTEPHVYITDPHDIENVLSSTQILKKSKIYTLLRPWLGEGLLTSYGSKWHSHRKMITPSFHFKILYDFLDTMNKNSTKFIQKLDKIGSDKTIFDIQGAVCYYTLDVICETAMGVSVNAMANNDSPIVKAFQFMCYSVQIRGFSPIKKNPFFFKFAPEYRKYKWALKTLLDFTMEVIAKRRELLKNDSILSDRQDVATNSIDIRRKQAFLDTLLTSSINGRQLTDMEIYEEVSTFMFEGHDTTTSGISFMVYLLSRHPEVQKRVFEEQMEVFNGDILRQPSFNDLQEMKYLDMVVKEAQRIYPSIPKIGRITQGPYDLNGTILPEGTTVNLFLFAMGYNEKYFPDPYKFDPERFNSETRVKASPYEITPFSAGPRNCIGQKFAMMEMKTLTAQIVRAFKILPPENELISKDGYEPKEPRNKYDAVLSSVLTLKSENGIQIRLERRTE